MQAANTQRSAGRLSTGNSLMRLGHFTDLRHAYVWARPMCLLHICTRVVLHLMCGVTDVHMMVRMMCFQAIDQGVLRPSKLGVL